MQQTRQKDKCIQFYLYKVPRIDKFIETENELEVTRGWKEGQEGMGSYIMGTAFEVGVGRAGAPAGILTRAVLSITLERKEPSISVHGNGVYHL